MKRMLEHARHLPLLGALTLLAAAVGGFAWGAFKTFFTLELLVTSLGKSPDLVFGFIAVVDAVLIATTLLIFSFALYELFVGPIDSTPSWLSITGLGDLKIKLGNMLVLVLAVHFLEVSLSSTDSADIMRQGIATSLVIAALVGFNLIEKSKGE